MSVRTSLRHAVPIVIGALLLGACAAPADPSAQFARQSLDSLKTNPEVAANAPDELAVAEQAVAAAEDPRGNATNAAHLGFVAQKRVQIAAFAAAANRDRRAYDALIERRDTIRHGNESITTLATDALGVTPQHLQFQPIGNTPLPPQPPVPEQVPQKAPPPMETPANGTATVPSPLLTLDSRAFAAGAALKPAARQSLDRLLPVLARQAQRPVVIYFGAKTSEALERAGAVKSYLLAKGLPKWLLFVAYTSDPAMNAGSGVAIDFEHGAGAR
jgi:hypothetical protein